MITYRRGRKAAVLVEVSALCCSSCPELRSQLAWLMAGLQCIDKCLHTHMKQSAIECHALCELAATAAVDRIPQCAVRIICRTLMALQQALVIRAAGLFSIHLTTCMLLSRTMVLQMWSCSSNSQQCPAACLGQQADACQSKHNLHNCELPPRQGL